MIVIVTLFCKLQFQPDELANGRFKLNQWRYLYNYKMFQTTSEQSSMRWTSQFLWGGGSPDKRFSLVVRYEGSLLKDFS